MTETKKKYLLLTAKKYRKKDITNLTHEISLSKLGTSFDRNGNSFHSSQLNFTKKLDIIQEELDDVVLKINTQQKRHHLLKNLVLLMKMESSKLQSQQKKTDIIQTQSYNKCIKKLRYDIDQIQQKCNQQIASITHLKEDLNAKRSQRVVFSNLFKTIQYELKLASQNYKQELIKSQIKKNSFTNNNFSAIFQKKQIILKQQDKEIVSKRDSSISFKPFQKKNSLSNLINSSKRVINMTSKNKITLKNLQRKFKESRFMTEVDLKNDSWDQGKQLNTLRINKQIDILKTQIQKVKVCLGEDIYSAIFKFGLTTKQQNQELQQKIQSIDSEIQTLQFQQKQLLKMKKNNQIVQYSRLPCLKRGRQKEKTQIQAQTSQDVSFIQKSNSQYIRQIAYLLLQKPNLQLYQTYIQIDSYIDKIMLGSNIKNVNYRQQMRKTDTSSSKTVHQNGPQQILQRMEKITEFEKLFDQEHFFQQYKKQINRPINLRCSKK